MFRTIALITLPVVFGLLEDCGRTNLTDLHLKTEQNMVDIQEHPHMCVLFFKRDKFFVFLGGASLVARNQLVTLATAFRQFRNISQTSRDNCQNGLDINAEIRVRCGDVNLQSPDSGDLSQTRQVRKVIIHPDYNSKSLVNDLAILLVDQPFDYTENVGSVCLPNPEDRIEGGRKCVATGHGRDGYKIGYYSQHLKKVSVPLLDHSQCGDQLRKDFFRSKGLDNWKIDPSFLCAGGESKSDTCEGDGGGPLVCNIEDGTTFKELEDADGFDLRTTDKFVQLVQVGVTAWGIQCGQTGLPSVYSYLGGQTRCWLDQVISCYQPTEDFDLRSTAFDLRSTADAIFRPQSAGGFTHFQCSDWLESRSADLAACGCKQELTEDQYIDHPKSNNDDEYDDYDLDLRKVD